ncbi:Methyltransferase type 12 [Beutenbergia cavernae DSM 12333]|uniref:Methyltransferase type 12 n=1 Tax=Beutenbergia cavernae (strain ATCC BAA-8 / DSM 12333 / CCUG 43141 / JCM 11478 / NBRC 16432 / NCIMB 13614 / HKI 0122) TaxID=471853 RepID=C5C554_BEUC1|nr:class I SAM-dependent methyltransferase [Beutenbergia cavernae]ACQ82194.1 Methyltransferase type 12 [Beutenbergia cavernae DSM 12333]
MPDNIFEHPRLAAVYDPLDPDRSDLDHYAAMVEEFGARAVLDVGCGTGTFATMLAARGVDVVGVDPAAASLDVARGKPHADAVTWIHGDATTLPPLQVDLAVMTGNVAQVFLTEEEWAATLAGVRAALRPGGRFVFETRDPAKEAWRRWTREATHAVVDVPGVGEVESWNDGTDVEEDRGPGTYVTFRGVVRFASDGAELRSTSTLWFRGRELLDASLEAAGFVVDEVRDAPDRPGLEFVYVTHRPAED